MMTKLYLITSFPMKVTLPEHFDAGAYGKGLMRAKPYMKFKSFRKLGKLNKLESAYSEKARRSPWLLYIECLLCSYIATNFS